MKNPRRLLSRAASLAGRGAKAVTDSPSKLMQRINQELYKRNAELAIRNKTLALLRKLDEISLATVDLQKMAEKIAAAIATDLGYELVSIAVVGQKKAHLRWLAAASAIDWLTHELHTISIDEATMPWGNGGLAVKAINEEKSYYTENLQDVFPANIARVIIGTKSPDGNAIRLHTTVYPLRFGQQVLGLLTMSTTRPPSKISRFEQESISGIVGLVALALYKADIYDDLQHTTAQLEQANSRLQALDLAKSEFLSIASHQLYTPLTAIRGYLSMLKEEDFGPLEQKQAPIIDIVNKSAERLIDLIKNLLDISRIESGRFELNLEVVDLTVMAQEIVQDLLPNAMSKNLKLVWHKPAAALPSIIADRQRLRQVVLNYVDNAIKYSDKGQIDVKVIQQGATVEFSVTDTGKGIDPKEINMLFTKFTRTKDASRSHTSGTGLGLYVARQIINEHRGEVLASSPGKGKGSTFTVRLPIADSPKSLKIGDKATVTIKAAPQGKN